MPIPAGVVQCGIVGADVGPAALLALQGGLDHQAGNADQQFRWGVFAKLAQNRFFVPLFRPFSTSDSGTRFHHTTGIAVRDPGKTAGENMGLHSLGWNVYGRRKEGKKSALWAILCQVQVRPSGRRVGFSPPSYKGGLKSTLQLPAVRTQTFRTELCEAAGVPKLARPTARSRIFRRRTTRLSEITACKSNRKLRPPE